MERFMKITWTFYPKNQPSVSLTIIYTPSLDHESEPGFLIVDANTAYVDWSSFRIFDSTDAQAKKDLFASLVRIDANSDYADIVAARKMVN
jgi:hypothetical protein